MYKCKSSRRQPGWQLALATLLTISLMGSAAFAILQSQQDKLTGSVIIVGPRGEIKLDQGVIVAQRHIHCHAEKAAEYGLRDAQVVAVQTGSAARQVTFHQVIVRVSPHFDWQMHIDTDEANAAGIERSGQGSIII